MACIASTSSVVSAEGRRLRGAGLNGLWIFRQAERINMLPGRRRVSQVSEAHPAHSSILGLNLSEAALLALDFNFLAAAQFAELFKPLG